MQEAVAQHRRSLRVAECKDDRPSGGRIFTWLLMLGDFGAYSEGEQDSAAVCRLAPRPPQWPCRVGFLGAQEYDLERCVALGKVSTARAPTVWTSCWTDSTVSDSFASSLFCPSILARPTGLSSRRRSPRGGVSEIAGCHGE